MEVQSPNQGNTRPAPINVAMDDRNKRSKIGSILTTDEKISLPVVMPFFLLMIRKCEYPHQKAMKFPIIHNLTVTQKALALQGTNLLPMANVQIEACNPPKYIYEFILFRC